MKLQRIAMLGALAALLAVASNGYSEPTEATGSVSGKVNGPDGQPMAGVMVKVSAVMKGKRPDKTADKPEDKKKAAPSYSGTTDDKGMFKIENVPAGTYQVVANSKAVGRAKANATVVAGQDFSVTLQLQAPKKKT